MENSFIFRYNAGILRRDRYEQNANADNCLPCYNEEEVLPETIKQLTLVMQELCQSELIDTTSKILFVDDGSKDRTWPIIAMESISESIC